MSTLISDFVALAKELTADFDVPVTVTQRTVTARDTFNKPTARTTAQRQALMEESNRTIRQADGVDKQARTKLTILENVAVDGENTDFVLPDGTIRGVLDFKGLADPAGGRYFTEVWLA